MLTLEQLTHLRGVCLTAYKNALHLSDDAGTEGLLFNATLYKFDAALATAALADIDAEIELLKGMK